VSDLINKIICGDCLDVMKKIPDNFIDLTLTSPPYDNLRKYTGYSFNFEPIASQLFRIIKNGGVLIWVVGDQTINGSESGTSFRQALYFKEIGFNLHDTMIYQKRNYVPLTHRRYEQSFEYMFILSKGKPNTFNPVMIDCKNSGKIELYGKGRRSLLDDSQAMRSPDKSYSMVTKNKKIHSNIFSYPCGTNKNGHPAPFPEQLAEDHILTWSNENDIVFDPFIGGGTTAKMALISNRRFIGCDSSIEYCEMANDIILKTGKKL